MVSLSLTMATSLFPKTTTQPRRFNTPMKQTHRFKVSCNDVASNDRQKPLTTNTETSLALDMQNVDRRNLLLGLGAGAGAGLYSTVNLTTLPSAFAVPIAAPSDISNCHEANSGINDPKNAVRSKACCPPVSQKPVKDFVFPRDKTRIRPAAHRASPEYVEKFQDAIQAMKALDDDDPHSFVQQAKIHCAYCNGGYTQIETGFPTTELQIHNSWLFFPFHRWYLYFFERILGKLINDPTFALPYWNWDNPAGMSIPAMFEDEGKKNPLFDAYRNAKHLPPEIADLDYNGTERDATCIQQISINLSTMYKQMIRNAPNAKCFFGGEYKSGDDPINMGDPSIGSIEAGCHTAIHRWVGDTRMPNNEDLGNFYSAGYDPLFYVHHANVDRMWTLWKRLGYRGHREPTDKDWLNASYVFYDENKELVRVYNKDCVRMEKLKYDYEKSDIPWLKSRSNPRIKKSGVATKLAGKVKNVEEVTFPVKLDGIVKVLVKRPAINRSKEDKEDSHEMLLIKGINFDIQKFVKFDVYVNDGDDVNMSSPAESEFAGSFSHLPHNHGATMMGKSGQCYGLTELIEDIEAEDEESVLVTLVPRAGCEDVTVSEIKIELVDSA